MVNICDVCTDIFAGGDAPKGRISSIRTEQYPIPIYSNGEDKAGLYGYTDTARVYAQSVTVSARGTIGYTAIRTEPFVPIVRLITLVPDQSKIDIKYLYYAVQNYEFEGSGTSIPQLTVPMLKKYNFPLPSKEEQQKVVSALDKVNELISLRKEQLAKLDQLVKSRFVELFGDLIHNTYEWDTLLLNECFEITSSKRILKSEWKDEGIPFLRVRDMVQLATTGKMDNEFFVSEEFYESLNDSDGVPKQGDILMSATSTLGKCHVVSAGERFYFKDADVLRFRAKKVINPVFFMEQMKTEYIEEQISRTLGITTVAHFTIKAAKTINMRLPNIELQNQFAAFVEQTEKSKLAIQQSLEKLELLKKSLMQEYFG